MGARQYPMLRNALLRVLEPLGAPTDRTGESPPPPAPIDERPIAVRLEGVSIVAGGPHDPRQRRPRDRTGEHVAVVGPSGAGKSSLVGLLLGWHRAAAGQVLIDGVPLDAASLEHLRTRIAWVDPEVHLWNRSLLDNVRFGASEVALDGRPASLASVMESADLRSVVEALPDGLQTSLGEGGAFLSGGQGQRVRLARGELRPNVGLVILDEALRGLDRDHATRCSAVRGSAGATRHSSASRTTSPRRSRSHASSSSTRAASSRTARLTPSPRIRRRLREAPRERARQPRSALAERRVAPRAGRGRPHPRVRSMSAPSPGATSSAQLAACSWPASHVAAALRALAARSGIGLAADAPTRDDVAHDDEGLRAIGLSLGSSSTRCSRPGAARGNLVSAGPILAPLPGVASSFCCPRAAVALAS